MVVGPGAVPSLATRPGREPAPARAPERGLARAGVVVGRLPSERRVEEKRHVLVVASSLNGCSLSTAKEVILSQAKVFPFFVGPRIYPAS